MKKLFTLFTAILFSIAVNAQTVVDIIVNSPDHNTLEAAVIAANLQGTLSGTGPFTVFAPTDAAFAALPAGAIQALLADIPFLTNFLKYHVVGANALSSSLTNGQMITTIQGQKVTVTINNGNVFINNAYVTVADIVATNGVVHVIDAVLLPPTGTVVDVIVNSPNHTILEAAVIEAGLAGTLSGTGPFTIFAPTDAAFDALPSGTVEALLSDIPALTNILTYHAVAGSAFSAGLSNGQMIMTIQGQDVTVSINNGNVFINNAQVTVADIVATNGVVHVIDAVLLPEAPSNGTVVDIIVNSPDHTTLEAAVIAAGLAGTLSETGPFTIFAPTDAAFAALPAGTIDALLADIPALTNILTYHAVGANALSSSLTDGQMITTIQGKKVTVSINNGNVFINNAQVTVADIVATNGVVHVIDAVLLPPTGTVVDVIVNSPNHTNLEAAVIAAGLDGTLSGTGPFTIFAPTDAAFEALPSGTVEALLADIPALTNILTYHAVAGSAFSAGLNDGQMIMTIQGQDVTVTIENGNVFINNAQVTVADIVATNGVVHVIDAVLLPEAPSNGTVVDIIVNSPDHTTLEAAVIAAGLAGTLSGTGPFTIFAPTDAAFAALPAGTIDALLADIPALTNILTYHAVAGSALSSSLTNGQLVTTIQGQKVTISINNGDVFINNAKVTVADIIATNGVVHVIDAVLVPPTGTVVDVIVNSPNHTTLEAAVIAAGLAGTLSGTGPFTIFAPTDAAFAALPAGTVEALLADIPALTNILTYHAVAGSAFSAGLNDGQMIMTIQGQDVTVTIENGVVFINDAQVTVADIVATNGVVHVIDAVLLPGAPSNGTVVDIIVNSPDHTTLETAVIAAGLAGILSGNGPFTVFAPTDAAFAALPSGTIDALLADPNGLLTDVLLHHVVGTTAFSGDLSNGQLLNTLLGDDVLVTINNGQVSIDNATVTVADIEATNGIVHVIDAVLVPITLGLDNINNSAIGVYPNPVSDLLRFNLGQTSMNATYLVYNQTGALVLSGKFNTNASSISVEDLQSGLYTVSVLENNKMTSIRFVKK